MDYRQAGVDIEAGREFVRSIGDWVKRTQRPEVLGNLGGFSGLFELPTGYHQPVLVSGTDGVGTKLKLAQQLNRHNTIGIDLVAMCVNDVLTSGAEPLFFLDYLATGKLAPEQLNQVVAGISEGCVQSGCTLLGGETAEMPGFYQPGEYDLAGFCVGVVEKAAILNGSQVQLGDVAIGLASSGVHSNGFSLVRQVLKAAPRDNGQTGYDLSETPDLLGGKSLGEALLAPTQLYVKPIQAAQKAGIDLHGMAHITGGGLPENLPRCLGPGQAVQLQAEGWPIPPLFTWLAQAGEIPEPEMFNTFNMGVGFVVIVPAAQAAQTCEWLGANHLPAHVIGEVVAGDGTVLGLPA